MYQSIYHATYTYIHKNILYGTVVAATAVPNQICQIYCTFVLKKFRKSQPSPKFNICNRHVRIPLYCRYVRCHFDVTCQVQYAIQCRPLNSQCKAMYHNLPADGNRSNTSPSSPTLLQPHPHSSLSIKE